MRSVDDRGTRDVSSKFVIFYFTWSDSGKESSMNGSNPGAFPGWEGASGSSRREPGYGCRIPSGEEKPSTKEANPGLLPPLECVHRERINNQSCKMNSLPLHGWRNRTKPQPQPGSHGRGALRAQLCPCLCCPDGWAELSLPCLTLNFFLSCQDLPPEAIGWDKGRLYKLAIYYQMFSDTPAIETISYRL